MRLTTYFYTTLAIVAVILSLTFTASANSYEVMKKEVPVDIHKKWLIQFNTAMDPNDMNASTIQIIDKYKHKVPITVTQNKTLTETTVSPINPFEYGETYTLLISDEIKATNGKTLVKGVRMEFSTVEVSMSSSALRIVDYTLPSGTFELGAEITSSLGLRNGEEQENTYRVAFFIEDPNGKVTEIDSQEISIGANGENEVNFTWTPDQVISGKYTPIISVSKDDSSMELAHIEKYEAFSLYNRIEDFESFDVTNTWEIRNRFLLGKGFLLKENVFHEDGQVFITLADRRKTGGEIRTIDKYQYGTFQAKMKLAHAPGSITGFFLYSPPDYYHEIDIEIYNDPSGTVLFTAYKDGKKAKHSKQQLNFDPTAAFHTYRFDVYGKGITFYIDDIEVENWQGAYSSAPMKLMVNSWYPTWLTTKPVVHNYTIIDEIQY